MANPLKISKRGNQAFGVPSNTALQLISGKGEFSDSRGKWRRDTFIETNVYD